MSFARRLGLALGSLVWVAVAGDAQAQRLQARIVIDTGVDCRTEPRDESATSSRLPLGAVFNVAREVQVDGTTWYFDDSDVSVRAPACWVSAPHTSEFQPRNPEPILIRMFDRLLERNDVRLEDLVEADNLVRVDWFPRPDARAAAYQEIFATSGPLQFRWLKLLDRALRQGDADRDAVNSNPLKRAWIWSLRDVVVYHEPSAGWYVRPDVYWQLFESYKAAPWAEELAWVASEHVNLGDECHLECALRLIVDGPLQYWTRFPSGEHVGEAIARATALTSAARDTDCDDVTSTWRERAVTAAVLRTLIDRIRNSLLSVQLAAARDIVTFLDDVAGRCLRRH